MGVLGVVAAMFYERVERSNRKRRVGREKKVVNEIAGDEEVCQRVLVVVV